MNHLGLRTRSTVRIGSTLGHLPANRRAKRRTVDRDVVSDRAPWQCEKARYIKRSAGSAFQGDRPAKHSVGVPSVGSNGSATDGLASIVDDDDNDENDENDVLVGNTTTLRATITTQMETFDEAIVTEKAATLQTFDEAVVTDKATQASGEGSSGHRDRAACYLPFCIQVQRR
jgi:hypothetical protein